MSVFNVEAEWHMPLKDKKSGTIWGHRLKVSTLDPDLKFYINGMVVKTHKDGAPIEWIVQTPKVPNTKKGFIVEFDGKQSKLWPEIKDACIAAVQEHLRHETLDQVVDMKQYEGLNTEEFNKKIGDDWRNHDPFEGR